SHSPTSFSVAAVATSSFSFPDLKSATVTQSIKAGLTHSLWSTHFCVFLTFRFVFTKTRLPCRSRPFGRPQSGTCLGETHSAFLLLSSETTWTLTATPLGSAAVSTSPSLAMMGLEAREATRRLASGNHVRLRATSCRSG
ncbi:unnamed protein product, partial [Ixodes persulcatus]